MGPRAITFVWRPAACLFDCSAGVLCRETPVVKFSLKTKATALVTAVVIVVFGTMGYVRHERLAIELLQVQSEQQAALAETVAADLADKLESHLTVLEQSAGPLEPGLMDDAEGRS